MMVELQRLVRLITSAATTQGYTPRRFVSAGVSNRISDGRAAT